MAAKRTRDVEKSCSTREFVAKLRRLADALDAGKAFVIHVDRERLYVPADAHLSIEHEREGKTDEVEFQVRWQRE